MPLGDRRPPPLEAAQAEAGADKAVIPDMCQWPADFGTGIQVKPQAAL